jgi:hypothetical protein
MGVVSPSRYQSNGRRGLNNGYACTDALFVTCLMDGQTRLEMMLRVVLEGEILMFCP